MRKCRLIRGQNYLSEHAIAVRANEENDTKFLLYLLDFMNLGQYSDQGATTWSCCKQTSEAQM